MKCRVALQESDEGFSVWVPGLPGCASQGTTKEEALANIADAVREYVDVAVEDHLRAVRALEKAGLHVLPAGPA
ncbi:type II toxin-antitoxin system HicB family antitoxin [Candidatus Palauibacter sp.]|uniref:type II toxin-antitoxin system HicB family antitoxin n=1 Tax=Candidatus Palauibacter sp. TaxID=3101350 RepID=UPI003B01DD56